jgi:hypothetical protein
VVSHASWTPLYDVHASIGKAKDPTSTIALHYRASITQATGENWSKVELTLSTASPQLGTMIPSLSPWRVGCAQPRHRLQDASPQIIHVGSPSRSRSRSPRIIQVGGEGYRHRSRPDTVRLASPGGSRRSWSPPHAVMQAPAYSPPRVRTPSPMRWRDVQTVSADALNATFGIPGRTNIPSDFTSHKVVIQVLHLQAHVEWICIPSKQQSVFLKVCALVMKIVSLSDEEKSATL